MEFRDFEWDEEKAAANFRKHGVTFREAATVFEDPDVVIDADPDHSLEEDRWVAVGASRQSRVLLVVHTERGLGIRLISARRATAEERRKYESQFG